MRVTCYKACQSIRLSINLNTLVGVITNYYKYRHFSTDSHTMEHKCGAACKGRTGNNVECFICGDIFFLKCFGIIDKTLQQKLQTTNSVIKFVCGKCQIKKRTSLGTQSQTSNDSHLLKQILDRLPVITAPLITAPLITAPLITPPSQNPTNATISVDDPFNEQKLTLENIYKSVLKLSDKVDKLHSTDNESKSMSALTTLISSRFKELSENLKHSQQTDIDFLDSSKFINWSMTMEITQWPTWADHRSP